MRTLKKATWTGTLLLVVAAAGPVGAGPDWVEGMCSGGGAGSGPGSACTVTGNGSVNSISGSLSQLGPGVPDLEDMYLIFIMDPIGFSATTVGPGTAFDTQLWLFRADPDGVLDGTGLLGNNDVSAVDDASILGPMSDDGTGISISVPGLFYLAISGGGPPLPPPDQSGRFPVALGLNIFNLESPTEISGPDGPGGMFAIDEWVGEGEVGSYVIALEGVSFIEPTCPWDCQPLPNGSVGINDFLTLLGQWGLIGASCDFDGGGVGINDFLELLGNWGLCP